MGTHISGHGREVMWWWTHFHNNCFLIWLGSYFDPDLSDYRLIAEKNGLSLAHLVPEILGSKVGLIYPQNVESTTNVTIFKNFASIFSLIFDPIDPFLLLVLDLIDHSFLQNLRSGFLLISSERNFVLCFLQKKSLLENHEKVSNRNIPFQIGIKWSLPSLSKSIFAFFLYTVKICHNIINNINACYGV